MAMLRDQKPELMFIAPYETSPGDPEAKLGGRETER